MKTLAEFTEYLRNKDKDATWTELADEFMPHYLTGFAEAVNGLEYGRSYADKYVAGSGNEIRKIVLLFWYHDLGGDKALSTYFITLLGTLDVLENQRQRMEQLLGKETGDRVFRDLHFPVLGEDLGHYPACVASYLVKMREELPLEMCQKVLAGNHHGVDVSGFAEDKKLFLAAPDLETFLKEKHIRLVAKLQEHCDSGKLWFEQHITQEVVDYVKEHQEIQTGVLEGNKLIVRKIPYNPSGWLSEKDPVTKRYYACHCPFVRASILSGEQVDSLWCYCSGGFTKLLMDYLYDQELQVELLDSALDNADTCRFAIQLPFEKEDDR